MAGIIHQLIDILEAELQNYTKLLELSDKKTAVIVKNDVDKLKSITAEENSIVDNNRELEKKRETVMDNISKVLNKDKSTLSLSVLAELLKNQAGEQSKLRDLNTSFKQTLNNLKIVNEKNGVLISQALEYVDYNINTIQSLHSLPPVSYQYGGKEKSFEGRNFFDAKQ